jgi:hypothetical protein
VALLLRRQGGRCAFCMGVVGWQNQIVKSCRWYTRCLGSGLGAQEVAISIGGHDVGWEARLRYELVDRHAADNKEETRRFQWQKMLKHIQAYS